MKSIAKKIVSYVRLAGAVLCAILLLFACSKSENANIAPEPTEKPRLILEVESSEIIEGDEVRFIVKVNATTTNADLYLDGEKLEGTSYIFRKAGTYKVVAKKDNHKDSQELIITVLEAQYETNVYVAGWVYGRNGNEAKYWKNGKAQALNFSNTGFKSQGRSISVINGDVYVGGMESNINGREDAVVWKNGEIETWQKGFSTGNSYGVSISSIYSYNGDLYAAGTRKNGWVNNDIHSPLGVGVYWKNGVMMQEIGEEINNYNANSISVDEKGVHIVGSGREGGYKAYYWNNNQINIINDSYQGYSVFTANGNVYMTGRSGIPVYAPVYWKNGEENRLRDESGSETVIVNKVFVDGNDVHAVGFKTNSRGKYIAVYWKNNLQQELSTDGLYNAQCNDVFVLDGDVYIAGYEDKGTGSVGKYWKNGEPFELRDGATARNAYSIVVVKEKKQ